MLKMKYVLGVDLGTSAVKILLVNQKGEVCQEVSKSYPLIQEKAGFSEQDPNEWVEKTIEGLQEIVKEFPGDIEAIEGMSFSGQMHGLVLVDEELKPLRNAILWNDTRTTKQCEKIYNVVGKEKLLQITKNVALEGFTLPKLLWVQENEPEIYEKAKYFLLPKDFVRFALTGAIHMEYSDAAGTLLLDIQKKRWSKELCELLNVNIELCPPILESHDEVGNLSAPIVEKTGLSKSLRVFAGGADNACGAIGAGILEEGKTLCSIGTSGVVLTFEEASNKDFNGKVHYFNHGKENSYYTMGVTLAAGYSLSWFKDTFAKDEAFDTLLKDIETVPPGANGLLFTPYIVGERTPHADAVIRGSFIGIDSNHERKHFVRAVMEGITFSLLESIQLFRERGKEIIQVVSIGGGAKNDVWLQMQADIFQANIVKLSNEQGPGMGAAMLAAYGCGWFESLEQCAKQFIKVEKTYEPKPDNVKIYKELFQLYKEIYPSTKALNEQLASFRK
jgi:xylulokinase